MVRIAHIITGLNTGGAETMLYKLLSGTDRARFNPLVISLVDNGSQAARIAETQLDHIRHPEVARALEQDLIWALVNCLAADDLRNRLPGR